jgi:hypothetical protein
MAKKSTPTRVRAKKIAKKVKAVVRSKTKKSQALAELLIEVCDKIGVSVSQDVWLIAKGVPKKK